MVNRDSLDDIAEGLVEDAEPFPQSDALHNPIGFDDVRRYKKKKLTDFEIDLGVSMGYSPRVSRPHKVESSRSFTLNNPIGQPTKKKRGIIRRLINQDNAYGERYAITWYDDKDGQHVKKFKTPDKARAWRAILLNSPGIVKVSHVIQVFNK